MPLSIWEYIRDRTRDAVLAGMQDAMDIVEQGDTNGAQHVRAMELSSRLSRERQLPSASMNGTPGGAAVNGKAAGSSPTRSSTPTTPTTAEAPQRPADASSFDDELERRLDSAARQSGRQSDGATPSASPQTTTRKKRGRPPKNGVR
jgi:hypothetical protein